MGLDWMQLSQAFDCRSLSAKVSSKGRLCRHGWSEVGYVHSLSSPVWKLDTKSWWQRLKSTSPVCKLRILMKNYGKGMVTKFSSAPTATEKSHFLEDQNHLESCSELLYCQTFWDAITPGPDLLCELLEMACPRLPDDAFQARFFWHRIWKICKCQCVPSQKWNTDLPNTAPRFGRRPRILVAPRPGWALVQPSFICN